MRITTFLLAESAYASSDRRFFVHGGGFVTYDVPEIPFSMPQMAVVVRLQAKLSELEDEQEHRLLLDFASPDGESVSAGAAEILLPARPTEAPMFEDVATLQVVATISPFPLQQLGRYTATLSLDGAEPYEEHFVVRLNADLAGTTSHRDEPR